MTARDAFGNPIDDDSPATTPAGATATVAAPPPPAPAPAPITPAAAALGAIPPIPTYGPSKTTLGERLIGFAFFLLFAAPLAVGGYVAYNAWHTAKDAIEVPVIKSRGLTSETRTPGAKPAPAPPSMLKATNIDKALRTARASGGRLTLLRVAPARADLQLARRGGGLDLLQLRADGGASRVRTPGTPGTPIPYAKVDAHAPTRLVHAAARRLHRSTKSIDYVVLMDPGAGGPRWSAYFTGGAAFLGDAHGHVVRRIS